MQRTTSLVKTSLISIVALVIAGCAPASDFVIENRTSFDGLFLTRDFLNEVETRVYELKEVPLLETLTYNDKKLNIASKQLRAIQQEQRIFLKTVSTVAPKARIEFQYHRLINGVAINASPEDHKKISNSNMIRSVETSKQIKAIELIDSKDAVPVKNYNSVKEIGAFDAHALGLNGKGIRIGVIDTGVDYTHKLLGGAGIVADENFETTKSNSYFPNSKIVGGIDLTGDTNLYNPLERFRFYATPDQNPFDLEGHGTHVAGTIVGKSFDEYSHDGVAPEAKIYAIKTVTRDGFYLDYLLIKALEYSVDPNEDFDMNDRLDVVNISLGRGHGVAYSLLDKAIDNISKAGTTVVAAAGNDGDKRFIVASPAVHSKTISVAASHIVKVAKATMNLKSGEEIRTMADFSSRGPRSYDGVIKPEITAPGVGIISALASTGSEQTVLDGTSMAAPHVTGAVALLKQKYPNRSFEFYKSLLMGQADPLVDSYEKYFPVSRQGAGHVNIMKSLNAVLFSDHSAISFGILNFDRNQTLTKRIQISSITRGYLQLKVDFEGSNKIEFKKTSLLLDSKGTADLNLEFAIKKFNISDNDEEVDGWVTFKNEQNQLLLRIPVLALLTSPNSLVTLEGASHYTIKNTADQDTNVIAYNTLGASDLKYGNSGTLTHDNVCDLKEAGYRYYTDSEGQKILQILFETHNIQTSWDRCETNVQFDFNGDGTSDLEATNYTDFVPGVWEKQLTSLTFNGAKVRKINAAVANTNTRLDYSEAFIGSRPFSAKNLGTYAVLEISAHLLSISANTKVKISTTLQSEGVYDADDFLNNNSWLSFSDTGDSSQILQEWTLAAGDSVVVKKQDHHKLIFKEQLKEKLPERPVRPRPPPRK